MSRATSLGVLALLAAVGATGTFFVHQTTAPRIEREQRAIQARNLLDLLPVDSYDNQPLAIDNIQLSHSTLLAGYRATRNGQPSAVLLHSQVSGYGGPIELLIGVAANGKLLGSKALRHSETPGLGARIAERPNAWLQGFIGKSLGDPGDAGWALKKDNGQFDQMAGATITSRAVVEGIHDSLRYFDEHREQLLGSPAHE
ncbi:RnfABCDGE type electron transport complex subunit G [Pseudomonas chlororaphis]|uniref:RnfABCDGE type electron transport complex subunit G n=1 Tax=Pseudomonas chlororaphis TaxID=587753 RepID=UPI002368CC0E|nr:RnfABCDGE type electron transport complex subunit G [Pseudomonas chlororaphis]WDH34198.1 RnfABCDGE type electron transport complex subunit G [Pseudomonas chlororaphis]WDH40282.1 RnfABCDGE type electron transport complex subunit G [Pseudomonas chlororaphis]